VTETVLHKRKDIETELQRIAGEILAGGEQPPVLVGIRTHGVPLAKRLAGVIAASGQPRPEVGAIDITLYRDDLAGRALPEIRGSEIPFDLEGRRVVLVDDVLFTGRTVRAALTVLADYGRPMRIELCVLVDRGQRELPICADYTGWKLETTSGQKIRVGIGEQPDDEDRVLLID
jgi:pyrimidine operon attenuation protein/uracil phosphoribosyltransferase